MLLSLAGSEAERACTVIVMNGGDTVNLTNSYTYRSSLTPVITNVSPRRGGTAGGSRLTITGTGFRCRTDQNIVADCPPVMLGYKMIIVYCGIIVSKYNIYVLYSQ